MKHFFLAVGLSACAVAPAAASTIVGGSLSGGTAVGAGGTFQVITPPSSVGGSTAGSADVIGFAENQGVVLASNLAVNVGNTIAAGTAVDSFYFDFDPLHILTASGTIDFDSSVLGIIDLTPNLNGSNGALGLSGVHYYTGNLAGFETGDVATITDKTISFTLSANTPGDAFRVITAASAAVPEPATWAMMVGGFGLMGAALRRKKASINFA